jgi:hypothetical protein
MNYPDRFVRHKNFQLWIDPDDGSDLFKNDATFRRRPGLFDNNLVSFESVNHPGYYIRHKNYWLWIDLYDGSGLFMHDATFQEQPGLAGTSFASFESLNYPGHYIRHKNYQLRIDPDDGSDLFKRDATFRITAALSAGSHPHLVRRVACREVRNNQPWGLMGKAGTFPRGPLTICRYMEFGEAGGRHDVELVAHRAPIGSQNYARHSSRKDFIDDPTPQTSYSIWFSDRRDNGNWREQVLLDGRPLGTIEYVVGGVGE